MASATMATAGRLAEDQLADVPMAGHEGANADSRGRRDTQHTLNSGSGASAGTRRSKTSRGTSPAATGAGSNGTPATSTTASGTVSSGSSTASAASRGPRSPWPFRVNVLAFTIAMILVIVRSQQRLDVLGGAYPNFWQIVRGPGLTSVWFAAFFGCATTLALSLHALCSYEQDVRRLGTLASLFAAYITVYLCLVGSTLVVSSTGGWYTQVHEICVLTMFFTLLAECAETGMGWTVAQVTLHIVIAIIMDQTGSRTIKLGGDIIQATRAATNWTHGLLYVYFVMGGMFRWGALHECQVRRASGMHERWWFRILLLMHEAAWFSFLSYQSIATTFGVDAVILFNALIIIAVYLLTPMMIVYFVALSHAQARDAMLMVEQATRQRVAAEAASAARSEFLRYVFHEVRVPFNSIVLGLEELKAYPELANHRPVQNDIRIMQSAADSMQRILNDTLEVEKMSSGTYALQFAPTNLREVIDRVVANMQPWARQDHVTLCAEVDPRLPMEVYADGNRLAQVLANFLSNALKFVDHGGHGRVSLRAVCLDRAPTPSAPGQVHIDAPLSAALNVKELADVSKPSSTGGRGDDQHPDNAREGEGATAPAAQQPARGTRKRRTRFIATTTQAPPTINEANAAATRIGEPVVLPSGTDRDGGRARSDSASEDTPPLCAPCGAVSCMGRVDAVLRIVDRASDVCGEALAYAMTTATQQIVRVLQPVTTPVTHGLSRLHIATAGLARRVSTAILAGRAEARPQPAVAEVPVVAPAIQPVTVVVHSTDAGTPRTARAGAGPRHGERDTNSVHSATPTHGRDTAARGFIITAAGARQQLRAISQHSSNSDAASQRSQGRAAGIPLPPVPEILRGGRNSPAAADGHEFARGGAAAVPVGPDMAAPRMAGAAGMPVTQRAETGAAAANQPITAAAAADATVATLPGATRLAPQSVNRVDSRTSRNSRTSRTSAVSATAPVGPRMATPGTPARLSGRVSPPRRRVSSVDVAIDGTGVTPAVTSAAETDPAVAAGVRVPSAEPASMPEPPADAPVQWIRLEVHDNGCGIGRRDQARLFRAFVQIEAGARQKGKGTGLGLFICHEIIRRHGGRIGVVSAVGRGSTFFAEIPLRVLAAALAGMPVVEAVSGHDVSSAIAIPSAVHAHSASGVADKPAPAGLLATHGALSLDVTEALSQRPAASAFNSVAPVPMIAPAGSAAQKLLSEFHLRILVVDDAATNRMFLARALRRYLPTASVFEAEDGAEAVAMMKPDLHSWDVVCMDKEMPVMDGWHATRLLRSMGFEGLVIGVTGNALPSDVAEFVAHGATSVVIKPVSVQTLLEAMASRVSVLEALVAARHCEELEETTCTAAPETIEAPVELLQGSEAHDGANSGGTPDVQLDLGQRCERADEADGVLSQDSSAALLAATAPDDGH